MGETDGAMGGVRRGAGASLRGLAPWLLAATLLAGCGRTRSDCDDCSDAQGGSGGSAGGGQSGGGGKGGSALGGAAGAAGGGNGGSAPVVVTCDVGAPATPLVRYSSTDLEWTLDTLVGPGPALTRGAGERFDEGGFRTTDAIWVQSLLDSIEARLAAIEPDEVSWLDCDAAAKARPECASAEIEKHGLLIYRRPLAQSEIDGYLMQFRALAAASPRDGARSVLTSMLLSPNFVFRIERGESPRVARTILPPPGSPPALPIPTLPPGFALGAYEIAARLSHFITRQAPDATLLEAAARGALFSSADRVAEVERLLGTAQGKRARVLQQLEWLALDEARTEPQLVAMKEQTSAFIGDVLENRNGSLLELLTSPRQPLNLELAQAYGIQADVGEQLTFVDLDPKFYAGVLGQGLWLNRRRGPTQRGQGVQERLLCTSIPPHPPGLTLGDFTGTTPRERIMRATSESPVCAGCHQQTDPIGFALEAFDASGRLTGFDTTGSVVLDGTSNVLSGPVALGSAVATSSAARYCAAQRSIEFLLDRKTEDPTERTLFECLLSAFTFNGGELDLNALALQVAASSAMTQAQQPATIAWGSSGAAEPLAHAVEECRSMSAGSSEPVRTTLDRYCQALAALAATRTPAP